MNSHIQTVFPTAFVRAMGVVASLLFLADYAEAASESPKLVVGENDTFVRVRDIAKYHGLDMNRGEDGSFLLSRDDENLRIPNGGRRTDIGGVMVWLHSPVEVLKKKYVITETDYRSVVQPILDPAIFLHGRKAHTVLLDPGHGGEDSGTSGSGIDEKELVLQIAHDLRRELVNEGFKVLMTREFDRFIPLDERAARAREWRADFMVSLHANSAGNKSAQGLETYVVTAKGYASTTSPPRDAPDHQGPTYVGNDVGGASAILGYALHSRLIKHVGAEDRGLRHARFLVLRETPCPSALVELGFLSNPQEAEKMQSDEYMEELVSALVQGVVGYAELVESAQTELGSVEEE